MFREHRRNIASGVKHVLVQFIDRFAYISNPIPITFFQLVDTNLTPYLVYQNHHMSRTYEAKSSIEIIKGIYVQLDFTFD